MDGEDVEAQRRKNDRQQTVELIETIASQERQLDYEREVGAGVVPIELVCIWFDDFYHPHDADFRSAFAHEELAVLAEFNAFFRAHERLLPRDPDSIQVWLDHPTWREIMAKAGETLCRWRKLNSDEIVGQKFRTDL